jgi:membrane protease YdiL (CAAX protease family)
MNLINQVFATQFRQIRQDLVVFLILFSALGILIYKSIHQQQILQLVAYISAIYGTVFCLELYLTTKPKAYEKPPIRKPKTELGLILLCIFIQVIILALRFVVFSDWGKVNPLIRISFIPFVLLFIYPLALAIIFWILGYRPHSLGFRWQGILGGIIGITFLGIASAIFAPQKMQFWAMYQEVGILGMLFLGFITAALSEEFVRYLMQSRMEEVWGNFAWSWLITGTLWALLHFPNFYNQNPDINTTMTSILGIYPIGLLWGYISYRTGSILPSILIHGTNLWGLHNF